MRKITCVLLVWIALVLASPHIVFAQSRAADGTCYELRTYTVTPGKLDTLLERFRGGAVALLEKHGMKLVAFWVPTDKPDTLVYVLAHPSRAAADEAWKQFRVDPEWLAEQKASQASGPLVVKIEAVFMTATDFSPMK